MYPFHQQKFSCKLSLSLRLCRRTWVASEGKLMRSILKTIDFDSVSGYGSSVSYLLQIFVFFLYFALLFEIISLPKLFPLKHLSSHFDLVLLLQPSHTFLSSSNPDTDRFLISRHDMFITSI